METNDYFHAELLLLPVQELLVPIGWQAEWVPESFWILRIRQKSRSIADNQVPNLQLFGPQPGHVTD
jgi:negative regulator of sigma E activity